MKCRGKDCPSVGVYIAECHRCMPGAPPRLGLELMHECLYCHALTVEVLEKQLQSEPAPVFDTYHKQYVASFHWHHESARLNFILDRLTQLTQGRLAKYEFTGTVSAPRPYPG